MSSQIHIAPNAPLYVALADPKRDSEQFDFELQIGRYQTTDGRILALPRAAVLKLNELEPRPAEEIQITKVWSGKAGESPEWTIALSHRSEIDRAQAESEPQTPAEDARLVIDHTASPRPVLAPPVPIRSGNKPAPPAQTRLFDRGTTAGRMPADGMPGTGTYGPAPARRPARYKPDPIPANIAVREILAFINVDPNTANWSAETKQDLASTVYIASVKRGLIGPWERK